MVGRWRHPAVAKDRRDCFAKVLDDAAAGLRRRGGVGEKRPPTARRLNQRARGRFLTARARHLGHFRHPHRRHQRGGRAVVKFESRRAPRCADSVVIVANGNCPERPTSDSLPPQRRKGRITRTGHFRQERAKSARSSAACRACRGSADAVRPRPCRWRRVAACASMRSSMAAYRRPQSIPRFADEILRSRSMRCRARRPEYQRFVGFAAGRQTQMMLQDHGSRDERCRSSRTGRDLPALADS